MQIIITQSEIESAIKSYIMEQIHVKPNMTITIDLKATRGAEGATAIIDIAPSAQVTEAAVQEPKKKEAEPTAEIKATPAKLFMAPAAKEVNDEPPITAHVQAQDEPAEKAPVLVPEAEAPVPARTSLFAGLKKPVNA